MGHTDGTCTVNIDRHRNPLSGVFFQTCTADRMYIESKRSAGTVLQYDNILGSADAITKEMYYSNWSKILPYLCVRCPRKICPEHRMVKLFRGQGTYNAHRERAAPWLNNPARGFLTKYFWGLEGPYPGQHLGDLSKRFLWFVFAFNNWVCYVLMRESCVMH